ncbi:MAG: hypothetical protein ACD_30C00052G0028 [uncultured bacterium]|uniref:Uncharacterized protein n=4 Tax=Microgenomates group TaxID=1794810 RepID=A0A1F5K3G2_9BACT|nr:MAG: hypothetical protein ACD_30C00052G0028 [uncultured bacterium]KKQ14809.1 MAG: hypothetical protein US28_C0029G0034 [Candidatus Daviesbacteria bacterium GW2011_GWA1_36_8]KKQ74756.1 MAG: hypothetical protein US96_C0026G0004 [Candidatus Woesebacteria bacterium GW2011_GWB1_38_5b]OGE17430.1 MAG: hypothetical protein A2858_00060 [Candidatus Daviesbacteria bacterium RIFCSPHIGHO2_01_FULL_36_37]OGE35308.1 MAG: hypothetical protein A3E66_00420 [Candidatus Daviesbacteria bacterium RIFCSPHIGHO2_12_F
MEVPSDGNRFIDQINKRSSMPEVELIVPLSGAAIMMLHPIGRTIAEELTTSNPIRDYLLYNTGDFTDAFIITSFADIILRIAKPEIPDRISRSIGLAFGSSAVIFAETVQTNIRQLGTAQIDDIPFGLLGSVSAVCFSAWYERKFRTPKNLESKV